MWASSGQGWTMVGDHQQPPGQIWTWCGLPRNAGWSPSVRGWSPKIGVGGGPKWAWLDDHEASRVDSDGQPKMGADGLAWRPMKCLAWPSVVAP